MFKESPSLENQESQESQTVCAARKLFAAPKGRDVVVLLKWPRAQKPVKEGDEECGRGSGGSRERGTEELKNVKILTLRRDTV